MGYELDYATSSQLEVKGFRMDIAEVAKRSGVPASALRYYEEKGLIASTGRSGLRRTFSPSVVDQLALIALGNLPASPSMKSRSCFPRMGGRTSTAAL